MQINKVTSAAMAAANPTTQLRRLQRDLQDHLLGGHSAIADAIVDAAKS